MNKYVNTLADEVEAIRFLLIVDVLEFNNPLEEKLEPIQLLFHL